MVANAAGPSFRPAAHITSATTTTILAGVAGQAISIQGGFICTDAGGVATNVTIQDGAGTNLFGTGVLFVPAIGSCLTIPLRTDLWGIPTAVGQSLQVVTSAAGPVEIYLEVVQR
jgi:hypothetical protein